jgi:Cytochrome C and Quinol oxidase polypeptide I
MLLLDRYLGFHFFSADAQGNPMMYVNLFWVWGHPEVYILILPAFGIFSEVIATLLRQAAVRLPLDGRGYNGASKAAPVPWPSYSASRSWWFVPRMSEVSDAFRRIERPNVRTNTSVQPFHCALGSFAQPCLQWMEQQLYSR